MNRSSRAFTIVELLVVVSIITVLVGLLMPAIGKARDQANVSKSQANLRNLMAAANTYAADWNDRQFTLTPDNLSTYGTSLKEAVDEWTYKHGDVYWHYPHILLGFSYGSVWRDVGPRAKLPIHFEEDPEWGAANAYRGYGWFRHPNADQFNDYINGRYYDPVFFPPKDNAAWAFLEGCLHLAGEVPDCVHGTEDPRNAGPPYYWPAGYCFSPAALMSPDVFGVNDSGYDFIDPWDLGGGFRTPAMSMAKFPELKTLMFEHHWLQYPERDCNPFFGTSGLWDGCEPYYFNHGYKSTPVTLFYDGHIEGLGQYEAIQADRQVQGQTPGGTGLWHREPMGANGYFMNAGFDWTETSHNILTVNGIRGRDKTAE